MATWWAMAPQDSAASRFELAPRSGPEARHWLTGLLEGWGLPGLVDDAALCAAELATNALLHARTPFVMYVRRTDAGIHLAVLDDRPAELPVPVPRTGSAADITGMATTGRGLLIVGSLSTRWGVNTSEHAKTVWAELEGTTTDPTAPIVVIGHHRGPEPDAVKIEFLALPVRAVVASGVHVDELIREAQLGGGDIGADDLATLERLLDDSAGPRLAGRHAALAAAAEGELRIDLTLEASPGALAAVGRLGILLARLSARFAGGAAVPAEGVAELRAWLDVEGLRQRRGESPRQCPLPVR